MMERRQIVALWHSEPNGVLVTLVHAEGSSYRRPGARLLTAPAANTYAGTISGGCLEAEVVRKSAWFVSNGARLETYTMTFDDTAEIPFGLGCGGTVQLLFEPVSTPEGTALLHALEASLHGSHATVVTFLPDAKRPLRRAIYAPEGHLLFASPSLSSDKLSCAARLTPDTPHEGRFVESLTPPQRLILCGAGDDAKPLVNIAHLLGWSVTVVDARAQLSRPARFPTAELVLTLDPAALPKLTITPSDAVIVMTHSYEQDRQWLTHLLPLTPRYLGLLGSRHRSSLLIAECSDILQRPLETCCNQLFAPVGLDLGGDGPEAIALAIIAEAQAICQGRPPGDRRLTPQSVAAQIALGGASRYLATQCALAAQ